jgi:Cu/Ag efflux protein CusF
LGTKLSAYPATFPNRRFSYKFLWSANAREAHACGTEYVVKNRVFICAVVAATAVVILHLQRAEAFSPARHPVARLPHTQFSLVQAQEPSNGPYRGVGVVTAINPATGSLTINHQEIEGLMPAMEMLFQVDPRTLSDRVKPGDKVEFQLEGKTYTIRDIKVIEPAK